MSQHPSPSLLEGKAMFHPWMLVVVAALLAHVFTLREPAYWLDEILTVDALAMGSMGEMLEERRHSGHQPLYFMMARGWSRLFGYEPRAMRVLSFAFVAAATAMVGRATACLGRRMAGWLAAALMALNAHVLLFSLQARPYALGLMLVALMVMATVMAERRPGRGWPGWIALASLLVMLTHNSMVIAVVAVAFHGLRRGEAGRPVLAAVGGALAAWIPWGIWCSTQFGLQSPFDWLPRNTGKHWIAPAHLLLEGPEPHGVLLWAGMAFGTLLVVALLGVGAWRAGNVGWCLAGLYLLPLFAAGVWLILGDKDSFRLPRYFTPLLVAQPVLLALALSWLTERARKLGLGMTAGLIVLMTLVFAARLVHPKYASSWEEMVHEIRAGGEAGETQSSRCGVALPRSCHGPCKRLSRCWPPRRRWKRCCRVRGSCR